jgi:PAS domain S-box-containing protein
MPNEGETFTVTADDEGKIIYWSKGAEEVLGLDEADAVGLNLVARLFTRFDLIKGYGAFADALKGGSWEGQIYARHRNGSEIPLLLSLAPIEDEEGVTFGVVAAGQVLPVKDPDGVDLKDEFLSYLIHERGLSPLTATTYLAGLERLERFCGKAAELLQANDVRHFLRESGGAPSTRNNTLSSIKAFFRWMNLEGYRDYSPILSVSGPKKTPAAPKSLRVSESRQILDLCSRPHEFRVIYFGLYAGCRVSESARITANEWQDDRLRFLGKGRKIREVPLHPMLAKHREVILSKQPSESTLKHLCVSFAHLTGIQFSSHDLRKTFGVMLSEARVSRDVIAELLGHTQSVTTASYVPVRWGELVEAMEKLTYGTDEELKEMVGRE